MQISWLVELSVKPEALDQFRDLTAEMVAVARGEAGVLIYERFVSADASAVYLYERFTDSDAALSHLRLFGEKFAERFAPLIERRRFSVLGSPSPELRALLNQLGATECLERLAGFPD